MPATRCPLCGNETLEDRRGDYVLTPPANTPGGLVVIPDAAWQHCIHCGEDLLPRTLTKAIESEQRRRLSTVMPVTS
jgi:YgiT-type zinc finger domain-containing protein